MRIIKSRTKNAITDYDIDRISREMVNVYHGVEYYDGKGQLKPEPKQNYLAWDCETMGYKYIPTRGFIYLNFDGGLYDQAFNSNQFRKRLAQFFTQNNRWGLRDTVFLEPAEGSSQFTVEQSASEDYKFGEAWRIVAGQPFHTKHKESQFCWILTDSPKMLQFQVKGKYPKPHQLMASLTTIVVDTQHSVDLEDGYHCLSFPILKKNITTLSRPLLLSKLVGIDGHVYQLIGGDYQAKRFGRFRLLNQPVLAPPENMPEKYHMKLKTLGDIKSLKAEDAKDTEGSRCSICKVDVFDQYYLAEFGGQHAVLCKFCTHFDPKVAAEINTAGYKVYRCESPTTMESLIEIAEIPESEKNVLKTILKHIRSRTLVCRKTRVVGIKFGTTNRDVVAFKGNPWIIGVPHYKGFQEEFMEQIHTFADGTTLFSFENVWN